MKNKFSYELKNGVYTFYLNGEIWKQVSMKNSSHLRPLIKLCVEA